LGLVIDAIAGGAISYVAGRNLALKLQEPGDRKQNSTPEE
jgi:hypothetical protein